MNRLRINRHWVGDNNPCFIVAEAGVNHQGEIDKAKQMVNVAVGAGATAVKFQYHIPDEEMIRHHVSDWLYESVSRTRLDINQLRELRDYTTNKYLVFLCTPFSHKAAVELADVVPAFKIGSGELNNYPFLEAVAKLGKPMILSTGMSTLSEIETAVSIVSRYNVDFALMVCVSKYPAVAGDFNLNRIRILKERFGCPVGFSDHSLDNHIAFAAVAMGANIIEKHFTLSRELEGDDHHMSLEPDELKELVRGVRDVEKAMKPKPWGLTKEDMAMRVIYNHSLASVREIPEGEKAGTKYVWPKRPGIGIPAGWLDIVKGRVIARNISQGTFINWGDLEL